MNHYFDDNRHLKSNRKEISFRFWCFNYSFILDNGVFSKDGIDTGTNVLLDYVSKQTLGNKILDLGCGVGPIGIILKKIFPESEFLMVDVNDRALELAKENAKLNEVDVKIFKSHSYEKVSDDDFSDIITNPPIRAGKQVIYEMFTQAYDHLCDGGHLWVVIRKSHGANSAKTKIETVFGNCEIVKKDKGFYILKAEKNIDNLTNR
ncbi:MAG: class I SAM-dependent methyltransferase [Clostridia bacterium]|nr:class I SAM-dependent methyltransferase [Erysipelotrichia bacterium]NCC87262.1 class I SAM-dependent methyltransferase [Clostridia bacterium]